MVIVERVLACLRRAAESDGELAQRENRNAWEGWCDARRVRRWLAAAADGKMPSDETLRRALAQLVKAGTAETRDERWRAVPA